MGQLLRDHRLVGGGADGAAVRGDRPQRGGGGPEDAEALEAFATPTIVHFGAVLLLAAFVTMPRHTIGSHASRVLLRARRQQSYAPVLSDWIWHICLPFVAYAGVSIAALVLARRPEGALVAVAGSALLLLFIGIHNAWDAAIWMTMHRKGGKR